ncbi:cytochrome c oxidase assembly protein [Marinimicrobium alkaliphilum]|uniref:cytochrome c oxidase assembly protein n=1 Tax=Marinimicrobium alkaliphilum TaxID=2202654 RepID=UPI000DBA241D|nr:cytochrome c oxidase assembly protein [Marinimicrobium alkaliphilum]
MRLVAPALLLWSPAVLAHNPFTSTGEDQLAAALTGILLLGYWGLYTWGSWRTRPSPARQVTFHVTAVLAFAALLGPLDDWAKTSTAAHMTQHMLLMVVIAPLWVLCRPLPQLTAVSGRFLTRLWRPGLQLAGKPMLAAYVHGFMIWFWHLPYFYMLAVENVWWHAFEHACFLITAGIFWWAVLRASSARTPWVLVALLFTLMHTGFLGAILTFANSPLYGEARSLQDQQLAGLIMWVAAAVPYILGCTWAGYRGYQQLVRAHHL